jgi:hypothetical protein
MSMLPAAREWIDMLVLRADVGALSCIRDPIFWRKIIEKPVEVTREVVVEVPKIEYREKIVYVEKPVEKVGV